MERDSGAKGAHVPLLHTRVADLDGISHLLATLLAEVACPVVMDSRW